MTSSTNDSTESYSPYESQQTRNIKFGLFVALEPPALICNFILVYYLITDRTLRHTLHYHAILILLIEVPRITHFLHTGIVYPSANVNCAIWLCFDYSLFGIVNIYMLWISLERYLFIFHNGLYATAKRRLMFHYLPSICIIVCVILFSILWPFFSIHVNNNSILVSLSAVSHDWVWYLISLLWFVWSFENAWVCSIKLHSGVNIVKWWCNSWPFQLSIWVSKFLLVLWYLSPYSPLYLTGQCSFRLFTSIIFSGWRRFFYHLLVWDACQKSAIDWKSRSYNGGDEIWRWRLWSLFDQKSTTSYMYET